ncbi:MAG: EpsG family protein [Lachnospiraceae bacterium]|nr:EpsG family protein [Lachnospiraceae bacterium]
MSIYYIAGIYIINVFLALFGVIMKPKIKAWILVIQAVLFSCLYGYRDISIGADTRNYVSLYNGHYGAEWGFKKLGEICHYIFGDGNYAYKYFLLAVCLFMTLNFAYFYYVMCKNNVRSGGMHYINFIYLAMFCMPYVISMSINVIRQGIAISLFLLGLALYKKRKKKRAWLAILFAPTFHKSIFIIEAMYFLVGRIRNRKKRILFTSIFSMFCILVSRTGMVFWILTKLPLQKVVRTLMGYSHDSSSIGFSAKLLFYWCCVLVCSVALYFYNMGESYEIIHKLISAILLVTTMLSFSELTASRFIINMDCILPLVFGLIYIKVRPKELFLFLYAMAFAGILLITLKSNAFASQLGLI